MKPYLIAAALAFLAAFGVYGYQFYTHTETLGLNRFSVLGLAFIGFFCLLLAVIAFFVGLLQKRSSRS